MNNFLLKMQNYRNIILISLLAISALTLGIAPLLIDDSYSWIRNTTSESAGQRVHRAWFARTAFVIYGIAVSLIPCFHFGLKGLSKTPFITFGLSMFAVTIFPHRPWLEGIEYNVTEDMLVSVKK